MMIPILLGVIFVVFFVLNLTPGDPATIILGDGATKEQIEALNHELGYDRPFAVRYVRYVVDVLKFDFGASYRTKRPIAQELVKRLPISARIALNAILFASLVGIPLGILSAIRQYSLLDTVPTVIALLLAAIPSFWLGMLLLQFFSLRMGWLPSYGANSWRHYVLPMVSLGLPEAAYLLRYTRSSMLDTIRQDYIRTVRSKGASERRVIWIHALKNALIPIVTIVGIQFCRFAGRRVRYRGFVLHSRAWFHDSDWREPKGCSVRYGRDSVVGGHVLGRRVDR